MNEETGENCNEGFKFWTDTLKCAKLIVAPMVDQSELAWRMLSRRYGADLCYTPMLHAQVFIKDPNYRQENLQTCPEDRPLIAQFCANDPEVLLKAAQMAEPYCDAIDLNLGCPQIIARRGHYGAFLQDEWDLVMKLVEICHKNLKVPITCKIRIFPSIKKTVEYAKMLESAGCQLLTVHGRTREQKGRNTGLADWSYIKAVREAVSIPVFANGNVQYLPDALQCIEETGVQGVMSAEGNLHNPALFHGKSPCIWDMVLEYLDLADMHPCPLSYVRGHVFKICHHALNVHRDVRELVASGKSVESFRVAMSKLKEICEGPMKQFESEPHLFTQKLPFPYWICQPYVRPRPDEEETESHRLLRIELKQKRAEDKIRLGDGITALSNKKMKKRLKHPHKTFDQKLIFQSCLSCPNPRGLKCEHELCKTCCREKASKEILYCAGHSRKKPRILYETQEDAQQKTETAAGKEMLTSLDSPNSKSCTISSELTVCSHNTANGETIANAGEIVSSNSHEASESVIMEPSENRNYSDNRTTQQLDAS